MARNRSKKTKNVPRYPTRNSRTIRRVKRSRRTANKTSPLKSVLKTVYQVVSALPILPAPIRTAADWVGRMFGLTSAASTGSSFVMNDGVVNAIEWCGFVRSEIFVTGNPLAGSFNEHKLTLQTNIRSVRPISISFTLRPQNPVMNRSGYYTMGFMPCTGPNSVSEFKDLDHSQLGYERFLQRMPVHARFSGSAPGSMSYTVPKNNTFLHNGIPLRKIGETSDSDIIGLVVIVYRRDDRAEYKDFSSDEISFDLRITGQCAIAQVDPLTPIDVYASKLLKDYNAGKSRYVFRNPTAELDFALKTATWNERTKAFQGQASDLQESSDFVAALREAMDETT